MPSERLQASAAALQRGLFDFVTNLLSCSYSRFGRRAHHPLSDAAAKQMLLTMVANPGLKARWARSLTALLAIAVAAGALSANQASASDYRTISASLRYETPSWLQSTKTSGHPVGCGATAWAMVCGYWKQSKGKDRLLDDVAMPHWALAPNTTLARNMEEIAGDIGSTYGSFRGDKFGRTAPGKMSDVSKYIRRRGYRCSVQRVRGSECDKFGKVKDWLDKDRPVILLINDPARALTTLHYPVIEKAELKQKKVFGKWRDRDVRYYVNMGSGVRKWIWVREYGSNDHPHTGSFSMFLLNVE